MILLRPSLDGRIGTSAGNLHENIHRNIGNSYAGNHSRVGSSAGLQICGIGNTSRIRPAVFQRHSSSTVSIYDVVPGSRCLWYDLVSILANSILLDIIVHQVNTLVLQYGGPKSLYCCR